MSRSQGIKLSLVSAGFVLIGIVVRDEVPWYVPGFFAVCLVIALLATFGLLPQPPHAEHLIIDDTGITRTAPQLREHIAWQDIARVRIITTDQGPHVEDVFFVLDGTDGAGCVVSQELAVRAKLLDALQARLPGLDNGAVIEAMTSYANRTFIAWQAPGANATKEAS